jgi:ABC-type transport system substrate-binding protein
MKRRFFSLLAILSALFLWGCYPEGPVYTEDMDIVITNHNPAYNFAGKGTYAMPDKIVKITGNLQKGDAPVFIPDANAAQIISEIAKNMQSLGWQRVDLSASPDMILTPASLETTTITFYYDYWGWWYGGYPGYGWGYYPPVYASAYSTGTLLMTLLDKNELGANGNPIAQWAGAINGVLTGRFDATRINPLIDKAFGQSSYLSTK